MKYAKLAAARAAMSGVVLAFAMGLPFAATAADDGELWEIKMDIPGMPAGMMPPQQACQSKDPNNYKPAGNMQDCKVIDVKQTATQMTAKLSCPKGPASVEYNYNAAHTEYKATMKMTENNREMTMNMAGRKIGSCDAQAAKQQREERTAQMKAEGERMQAQASAMRAQQEQTMAKSDQGSVDACTKAVETMNPDAFMSFAMGCYTKTPQRGVEQMCAQQKTIQTKVTPKAASVCPAKLNEYCARYQTMDGYMKAEGRPKAQGAVEAADMCGLSSANVRASLCPQAVKAENVDFIGAYCQEDAKQFCPKALATEKYGFIARNCPVETTQVAKQHCGAGRDYTSKAANVPAKYWDVCDAYLKSKDFDESDKSRTEATPKKSVKDEAVKKLKGIFGH